MIQLHLFLARASLAIAQVFIRLLQRSIMSTIAEVQASLAALEAAQAAESGVKPWGRPSWCSSAT